MPLETHKLASWCKVASYPGFSAGEVPGYEANAKKEQFYNVRLQVVYIDCLTFNFQQADR